jgi:hypothetical protein
VPIHNACYGDKKQAECTDPNLPDQLNEFYARFDRGNTTIPTPALSDDAIAQPDCVVIPDDVKKCFSRLKERKSPGPDGISPRLLKNCASELAPVYTCIFNKSLEQRKVPALFKEATIIPVPKKNQVTTLNDYRPVALTAVPMKSFERIMLKHIKTLLPSNFDHHQFAYRRNRSVEDAISLCLHNILQHPENPSSYARILFIDYSSAFNTIIPSKLHSKLLHHLAFPSTLCDWILNFLISRQQTVKINNHNISSSMIISTGTPQGCVLSPMLYPGGGTD